MIDNMGTGVTADLRNACGARRPIAPAASMTHRGAGCRHDAARAG
jgi:hypothetical protein